MLNYIYKRWFLKQHIVKVKNTSGATTELSWKKLKNLLESKPDVLIVHAGTNDLPKNISPLNNLRKAHRKCPELSLETKLIKDKNKLDKHRKDVNARMKNFCKQKR